MKMPNKLLTCGASALVAAALGLQAQTTTSGAQGQSTTGSGSSAQSSGFYQSTPPSGPSPTNGQFGSSSAQQQTSPNTGSTFNSQSSVNSTTPTGSTSGYGSTSSSGMSSATNSTYPNVTYPNSSQNTSASSSNQTYGTQNNTSQQNTTQNVYAGGGSTVVQSDAQVTTFVQQLDAQGPAVVQQISTQLGDLACSQDTVQNLVEALHSGQSVTITSNVNGQPQSSTLNPQGSHLGYGEAYIALAMAAQQLRNSGVTTCATPQQWQSVLFGGPLSVSQTSSSTNSFASASGSTQMPGIVTLHAQGQGWGQIAQSTNVQLGQIISNSSTSSTNNVPSETGYSSSEMNQGRLNTETNESDNGKHKGEKKHHWWSRDKDKDKDNEGSPNSTNTTGDFSSTHADTSGSNSNPNSTSNPSTR